MIKIRRAKREDIKEIIAIAGDLHRLVQSQRGRFFGRIGEFRETTASYWEILQKKGGVILVAESKDLGVVGYVYATIEKQPNDLIAIPYVSVQEIAVAKHQRRAKVGTLLMAKVHKWALENKLSVVQLATWEFNKAAVKFFEKLGYKTIMRKMEKRLRRTGR